MLETILWLFGGWCAIAIFLGVLIGKAIREGLDTDAPAHVSTGDWQRVIKPVVRSRW
jgi:hypothetical protein